MRYYDNIETPLTGKTFLEPNDNRVPQTDASVSAWFKPLPEGYQRAYSSDGLPFNELIPLPTKAELTANATQSAQATITNRATTIRAQLAGNADFYKVAGWSKKASLAQKVVDGTATAAELLVVETEASQRGRSETANDLAAKQLVKGQQLAMAIAAIDGMESAALSALKTCTTVEEVQTLLTQLDQQAKAAFAGLASTGETS